MAKDTPTSGVIVPRRKMVINPIFNNPAPLPPELDGLINVREWVKSLTTNCEYKEPNPDFMAQRMMMLTLSAGSLAEAMTEASLDGLQKLIPDVPWQGTGPITITELYVAASDIPEGNKTFMLFSYMHEETGFETTTTTGATKLQLLFAFALAEGEWPIRGQIKRTDRKDKGGRHLFNLYPVDA